MPHKPGCDQKKVLPPWVEHPFRLLSWYDMNKFSAGILVNIGSSLQWFICLAENGKWSNEMRDSGQCSAKVLPKT
jgi:hypothetical protein